MGLTTPTKFFLAVLACLGWGCFITPALMVPAYADGGFARCPLFAGPCSFAQPLAVGVQLEKAAGDGKMFSHGSGVYMGHGVVLTAAHVVKLDPDHPQVTVVMDGVAMPGSVAFMDVQDGIDLAMVKIAPAALRLLPARQNQAGVGVCAYNPGKSQPAVVISDGQVTRTMTVPAYTKTPPDNNPWTDRLEAGLHPGNSGGGVFDPIQGCLWGIVVSAVSAHPDPSKSFSYDMSGFTGATEIWRFLSRYRE